MPARDIGPKRSGDAAVVRNRAGRAEKRPITRNAELEVVVAFGIRRKPLDGFVRFVYGFVACAANDIPERRVRVRPQGLVRERIEYPSGLS
ncbi:hypothetical protein NRB56_15200 [Nocardia sp. RB56]|uniref:Uncharacterized protein n=1 Tax=Nocardia aurantia TaxID=2585199 RepID=A0A7K0DK29_9NOCA|nr:hypothetical protein [Nocardia aurantia]